jgi:hypothetical protein
MQKDRMAGPAPAILLGGAPSALTDSDVEVDERDSRLPACWPHNAHTGAAFDAEQLAPPAQERKAMNTPHRSRFAE